jgi:hypothetical protein
VPHLEAGPSENVSPTQNHDVLPVFITVSQGNYTSSRTEISDRNESKKNKKLHHL